MNLENTFTTTSEIREPAEAPCSNTELLELPELPEITELAGEPRGEREAVVIDEFDPTLSFRDAKERAIGLWERWYVAALLRHTGGNLSEAARVAHSDRSHLRKLVRKHLRSAITPP
ncbi:MAG TPA: hypothetical protein VHW23_17110 [Kofleriaceae bacterium]|jgi:DNA-binding NtrC family response regulator|nr:hypothetical protein [Kofleriaceae bacterium]